MSRRSREPFRELIPKYALKTRYEEVADLNSYAFSLPIEEREWLNRFAKEYVSASFDKDPSKRLHTTVELVRDCYNKNNCRNRDIYTKEKAMGTMNYLEDILMLKTKQTEEDFTVINEDSDNLYEMFEEDEASLDDLIPSSEDRSYSQG